MMFLLDLSGSMYGQLHVAKGFLKQRVRELDAGKQFNVAGFSAAVENWHPTCIVSTAAEIEAACAWISRLGVKTSTNTMAALNEASHDPAVSKVVQAAHS